VAEQQRQTQQDVAGISGDISAKKKAPAQLKHQPTYCMLSAYIMINYNIAGDQW
jgi:hypothetical protein